MYDVQHCVFKPKKMTKEQLENGTDFAWRETYSNLNILKRLAPFKHSPWLSFMLNFDMDMRINGISLLKMLCAIIPIYLFCEVNYENYFYTSCHW